MNRTRNDDRAHWASVALKAYRREIGVDDGCHAVHDLIADLGHYAAANDLDFIRITADAISCWCAERAFSPGDDPAQAGPAVSIIIPGRKHPMRAWRQSATTAAPRRPKGRGGAR